MLANLENSTEATGLEKVVFIPIPKKGNAKECSNYHTTAFISHVSKITVKILQARLKQYMNHALSDDQVKNPPANAGDSRDTGSISKWERSPGVGNGNPL